MEICHVYDKGLDGLMEGTHKLLLLGPGGTSLWVDLYQQIYRAPSVSTYKSHNDSWIYGSHLEIRMTSYRS